MLSAGRVGGVPGRNRIRSENDGEHRDRPALPARPGSIAGPADSVFARNSLHDDWPPNAV